VCQKGYFMQRPGMSRAAQVLTSTLIATLTVFAQQSKSRVDAETRQRFTTALHQVMAAAVDNFKSIIGRQVQSALSPRVSLPGCKCYVDDTSDVLFYRCLANGGSGDFSSEKARYDQLVEWVEAATGLPRRETIEPGLRIETRARSGLFESHRRTVFREVPDQHDEIPGAYVVVRMTTNGVSWLVTLTVGPPYRCCSIGP